jgi:hypothetical protein
MEANMAFVTDKSELKPGLILFRRRDVEHRMWYCRTKMPVHVPHDGRLMLREDWTYAQLCQAVMQVSPSHSVAGE